MHPPLLTELPYRPDSAALFEAIAEEPWAVFLDSGMHHPGQSRYDILTAQPSVRPESLSRPLSTSSASTGAEALFVRDTSSA